MLKLIECKIFLLYLTKTNRKTGLEKCVQLHKITFK